MLGLSPRAFAKANESHDQNTCKLVKQVKIRDRHFEGHESSENAKFRIEKRNLVSTLADYLPAAS